MNFLNINILWNLVWIIPLFFIMILIAKSKRTAQLKKILGKRYSDPEYNKLSKNKRILRLWLLIFVIVFLIIAASRPYWGYKLLPYSGSGRDILAVIDISKSMKSQDISPSRLAHAKHLLKDLIKLTPGDRYGIIAFAGSAFLECPLTADRTSLYTILKDINYDTIPIGGTNIEKAINVAIEAFHAASGGYKAIILITDGDELQGNSNNAIQSLKKLKTPLLVVGIGNPSKPGLIQLSNNNGQTTFLRDSEGKLVKSKLNEPQLRKLAEITNGVYIRSTATDPGLKTLQDKIIQLMPEKYDNSFMTRPLERAQFPLLIAVILFLLWFAIGERTKNNRSNSSLHIVTVFLLFSIFYSSPILANSDNVKHEQNLLSPINASTSSDTEQSNEDLQKTITSTSIFNSAVDAHSKQDLQKAVKLYTDAINLSLAKPEIRSKSYQNMGVMQHEKARKIMEKDPNKALIEFEKAEKLYVAAMREAPHLKENINNQQILLNDRKIAKEIIKLIKEMKKRKQEAIKITGEALKEQKIVNLAEAQKNEDQQVKAQQKTIESEKIIQSYNEIAQKIQSKQDTQTAQGALQDIKNAQTDQIENKGENAEKNIIEALKKLIGQNNKDQDKQNQDKQKQNKDDKNKQNKDQDKQKQNQDQQKDQMKNKKDEAKQKTKEALDKQQQANNSSGKDKQNKQQDANKKTNDAKDAIEDYQKSAKQNNSKQDEQNASNATQNIDNAKNNQTKNQGKDAEEDLKKALANLNNKSEKPKEDQNKDDKLPSQPKDQPQKPKEDNQDIDPKQAAALLKLMAKDEKTLKEEIKKRQKAAYETAPTDKDW